ncbi:MAG: hypothetical protein QM764_02830 [Chitinophagaceae bacterium]
MRFILFSFLFFSANLFGQVTSVYKNLPMGKHSVGFRIFTITDPSRIVQPEYNYLGEKITGDRKKKITVHLWYPCDANSHNRQLVYSEYYYNRSFRITNDTINEQRKNNEINACKQSVERWWGKVNDTSWNELATMRMLAHAGAAPFRGKFPLLIGMLRPLSTAIVNEMLASNGYVVAMVTGENTSSFSESALFDIPDMRLVMIELEKTGTIDMEKIGTFGFSGSGFSQVLFAMNDYRVKAVADIESGIYMNELFQSWSASNYYRPEKLRATFLHIFSRDLSHQEKFITEFENKTMFAKRYCLLLNQPALHHWDFATEGYTSCLVLKMRGAEQTRIQQAFELSANYLLNFFNAELKKEINSIAFMDHKPSLDLFPAECWDISTLSALRPAPTKDELEYLVEKKGMNEALSIVRTTIKDDSSSNILLWYNLNNYGYRLLQAKKISDAIAIFKLNTEFHPGDPNLFDSLAEAYEENGDKENMRKTSSEVIDLLNKKSDLNDAEKGLKKNAEKRLQQHT